MPKLINNHTHTSKVQSKPTLSTQIPITRGKFDLEHHGNSVWVGNLPEKFSKSKHDEIKIEISFIAKKRFNYKE